MSVFLRQLQQQFTLPIPVENESWPLKDHLVTKTERALKSKNELYFSNIATDHLNLATIYDVNCILIKQKIANFRLLSETEKNFFEDNLVTALILSDIAEHTFDRYLAVRQDVKRFRKEGEVYRQWLKNKYHFNALSQPLSQPEGFWYDTSRQIRQKTLLSNWLRLFIIRLKRFLETLMPILSNLPQYSILISKIAQFCDPILLHVAWVFYIPRSGTNLFLFIKHLIPCSWMSEEEQQLGFFTRLQLQWQRRGFEFLNDIVWLSVGLLRCFSTVLTPFGFYTTFGLALFDFLVAGTRALIELNRLITLENRFSINENTTDLTPEESKEHQCFMDILHERIKLERQRFILSTCSASLVLVGITLALPIFASPMLAFLGAALILATTTVNYFLWSRINKLIDQHRGPPVPLPTNEFFTQLTRADSHLSLVSNKSFEKEYDSESVPSPRSKKGLTFFESPSTDRKNSNPTSEKKPEANCDI